MQPQSTHPLRVERWIATARVALAGFSLLAARLQPFAPLGNARATGATVLGYLVFGLLALALTGIAGPLAVRLRVLLHAVDLGVACAVMWLTGGAESPVFVLLTFALVAAALRWPLPGTAATAAVAIAVFLGLGAHAVLIARDPDFEVNRFVLRGGALVVVSVLIGLLGAHEHRLRAEVAGLAAWRTEMTGDAEQRLAQVLERAAGLLEAPRLLLIWEEPDEPWWSFLVTGAGGVESGREAPALFEPLVAEALAGTSFLSADCAPPDAAVERATGAGVVRWRGAPLHPALRARFAIRSVVGLAVGREGLRGYLFALDKHRPATEDLTLGMIVARQVEAELELLYLIRRQQAAAATAERVRLARELHDGVIQSLGGAALQLEVARRRLADAPDSAERLLVEVQGLLAAEQEDLRAFVRDPGPRLGGAGDVEVPLRRRLDEVAGRVARLRPLAVEIRVEPESAQVRAALAHEVDRIVQEALVNAARHGQAKSAVVAVRLDGTGLGITIADDGHGFAFTGDYDFAALQERRMGPVTLKQRVAAAGGELAIRSSAAGARLEIRLPLP